MKKFVVNVSCQDNKVLCCDRNKDVIDGVTKNKPSLCCCISKKKSPSPTPSTSTDVVKTIEKNMDLATY